jgi:membrane peptidoglycan carboxypeptidase
MDSPRPPRDENGFQSRSLWQSASNVPRRAVPQLRKIMPRAKTGGKIDALHERIRRAIAWARARGRRQLIKDAIFLFGGLMILYFFYLWITLPNISDPRSLIASQSSVIVDRNGTELYRLYREEDRTFIPKEQIPEYMRQAIVSIEDERFYDRGCLDVIALARAFFKLGQSGGASTLTRQLARNALDLKRENIISRKLKEIILGCQLESEYTKDDLLNLYLNWIPFGQNAYGIELASRTYFGTPAKDLDLAQSAMLAALPQAPSYYSPYGKHVRTTVTDEITEKVMDGAITKVSQIPDDGFQIGLIGNVIGSGATTLYIGGRTDQVLKNMEDLGYITEEKRLEALEQLKTITFKPNRENIRAAHFVLWVKAQVEELLAGGAEEGMLNQGGLVIETTLDWDMQKAAEDLIMAKKDDIAKVYEAHNIAMVAVERGTNRILTYVGNSDYADEEFDGKVDMARAARQPGSSFKPFVYATAFEKGFNPATVLFDVATKIGDDQPQNFDGSFWGLMNARRALGASRNIPAIKMYFAAGEENEILALGQRIGIVTPSAQKEEFQKDNPDFEYGWPLALGAGETPLTEMVNGYATFANGGVYKPLIAIQRIKDRRGNILYEADPDADGDQALDPRVAYQIMSVLSDVGARPNEFWQSVLTIPGFQTAAKTGTSNKCLKRDANDNCTDRKPSDLWTMGFTPNIVAGIWIGNADSTALNAKAESLNIASPIWKEYMIKAHKVLENPKTSFDVPEGIVQPQISTLSGQLPTECTPVAYRKSDVFRADSAPSEEDPACVRLLVDRVTGLLASNECPAEATEERSFFAPQDLLPERFPQWQQSVIAWATNAMKAYDPMLGSFSGAVLPLPLAPTKECTISMTPGRMERPDIDIEFPNEGGGASYPSFQPQFDISVGSRVREITVEIDGKQAARAADARNLVVNVPRSINKSGNHTLKVTLIDEYYNEATDEVTFRFEEDNDNPSINFVSPRSDFTADSGETIVIEADADDNQGGIKYVQFYLDERLLSTKPSAPYRLEWPQDLNPGTYELRAVATDLAGNTEEDSIELTIE